MKIKKSDSIILLNKIYSLTLLLINDLNTGAIDEFLKNLRQRDRLFEKLKQTASKVTDEEEKEKLLELEQKLNSINKELENSILISKSEIELKQRQLNRGTKVLKAYKGIK